MTFLAEINGHDGSTESTYYYSDQSIRQFPSDDADRPNQFYDDRILNSANYSLFLFGRMKTDGDSQVGIGFLELTDADGALDSLLDVSFDTRDLRIYYGDQAPNDFSGYSNYLAGTISSVEVDYSKARPATFRFNIENKQSLFDRPIAKSTYDGSNASGSGKEGTADDIKGENKPIGIGRILNARPVLVNSSLNIYQMHDGSIQSVDAVRQGGVAVTVSADYANLAALEAALAATIPVGQCGTCLAEGLVGFRSQPSAVITVDFKGDADGATGYTEKIADCIKKIALEYIGLTSGDVVDATFTALNAKTAAPVGIYVDDATTARTAVSEIARSGGCYVFFNEENKLEVGRLDAPTGSADLTINAEEDGYIDFSIEQSQDDSRGIPPKQVIVEYAPLSYLMRESDFLGAATAGDIAEFTTEYRKDEGSVSSGVETKHKNSTELVKRTRLAVQADAATERARLETLFQSLPARKWYRLTLNGRPDIGFGDEIEFTFSRFGLSSGKSGIVLGKDFNAGLNRTTLYFWG